jgi:importin subunit beta-1
MFAAIDCETIVQRVVLAVLDRLENSMALENQILDADDRANHSELQSSLLGVLTNCIRRLGRDIGVVADRIMTVILQLLNNQSKHATTTEDAFLAVGAMTTSLEADFGRYAESFIPKLCEALQNPAEHQLCLISVGIIGDICRALGKESTRYCQSLMELLVANLQNSSVDGNVKTATLSCFGDVALAIGADFAPFLEVVMMALQQASSFRPETDNIDVAEHFNLLYEGVIEAYVGIVQGLNGTPSAAMLERFLPHMFEFIHAIAVDPHKSDSLTRACIGLLG